METAEIVSKIQSALKSCAESNQIPTKEVRVRIARKKGFIASTIKCDVMRKTDSVSEVSLKDLLGLNPIQAPLVNTYLGNALANFAKKENIDENTVNGRFYTTSDDFNPRLYLYNNDTPIREVKIEELIN